MTPDGMVATIRLFIKDESSFQVWKMKQKQKWPKPEFFTMSHRLGGGAAIHHHWLGVRGGRDGKRNSLQ